MTLEEYRTIKDLTYKRLSLSLGFSENKTYRICKNEECVKLRDAYRIVNNTQGHIAFADLLPESC